MNVGKNNKAVFLDRDGVINIERGMYTWKKEDWQFVPGIFANLRKLQEAGFLLIVITNQGGIAKKQFSKETLEELHRYMEHCMAGEGIALTGIYYCPHHNKIENCLCRKPGPLMIEKAMAKYRVDPRKAYMIGDTGRDQEAGKRAGIKSYQVPVNENISCLVDKIIKEDECKNNLSA